MRLILTTTLLSFVLLSPFQRVRAASEQDVPQPVVTESEKTESQKESEIPLNLEAPKKASEESHPLFKVILVLSMLGLVGTGAFVFIRRYSKNSFSAGKYNQIKVLTQHYLGPKKSLMVVRVAGESILIGVTDHNISMIKSLALLDDEVPEEVPNSDFADLFGGVPAAKVKMTSSAKVPSEEGVSEDEEEFSIRGVKEVVAKKLKGMRSFQ